MELANETLYLGFGLIFFALSFNAVKNLKTQFSLQNPKVYWAFSLASMALSCFFFSTHALTGSFALTLGNLTGLTADIGLYLLFKSWNATLKKSLVIILLLGSLPLGLSLEYIRVYESYEIRMILISCISIALSGYQLYELFIKYKKSKSIYVAFIALAISIQIVLWMFRIWMNDYYPDFKGHISIFDEHIPEFIARLILIVLYVLIFIGIGNYYFDKLVASEQQRRHDSEEQILIALVSLAGTRDNDTGNHIIRTQHYVKVLANRLEEMGYFASHLHPVKINNLFKAASLHDIGKVGIPDHILLKPGKLTAEEWEIMKNHALIGRSILEASEAHMGIKDPVIECAILIAGSHHEKWDGSGYPNGLCGEDIPLEARIMALADMYDALVTTRPYKPNWSHEEAVSEIVDKKGTHFDPAVVEAFMYDLNEFKEIASRYRN